MAMVAGCLRSMPADGNPSNDWQYVAPYDYDFTFHGDLISR